MVVGHFVVVAINVFVVSTDTAKRMAKTLRPLIQVRADVYIFSKCNV
jgi:hypothetical protein